MINNKKNNKIFIYVLIVVLIAILIIGATYAYWTWSTVRNNEANISLVVTGSSADLYASLEGGEPILGEEHYLLPTSNCIPSRHAVSITYKNATSKPALVEAQLDLTDIASTISCDKYPTDSELSHVHWAITTNNNSCVSDVVSKGDFRGMEFECVSSGGTSHAELTNYIEHSLYGTIFPLYRHSNGNNTVTNLPMISVLAEANMVNEGTENFYLYVWVDSDYNWINYGYDDTDPLGNFDFVLEWHAKIDQNLVCGDVTGDGIVTSDDVSVVSSYIQNGISGGDRIRILGDINGDSYVTATDILQLLNIINGGGTPNCPI